MRYFHCEDKNALFVSLDQIHHIKGRSRNGIKELENQFSHLAAEAEQFQDRHQQLQDRHEQLQEDSQQHEVDYQRLQKDYDELLDRCQLLQEEYQQLQGNTTELQTTVCTYEAIQQQLTEENQRLKRDEQEVIAFGIDPWKVSRDHMIEVTRLIGIGGWGAVQEGRLRVAVKQIHPPILSEVNVGRLKREMQMLALVRHPNLVLFFAVVFDEKADLRDFPPYIITELLDTDLRSAYERKVVDPKYFIGIFQDVARALDYLHQCHEPIIHRDVSSANVLLKRLPRSSWVAKLSDLGSANFAREAYTMNEGAAVYCAPEAVTDARNTHSIQQLTPKVDVFSYGILLCEVATTTFPDEEQLPLMLARVQVEWPNLCKLIDSCTAGDPKKRPTMANILDRLENLPQQDARLCTVM